MEEGTVCSVMTFDRPWPSQNGWPSLVVDNGKVRLESDQTGRFILTLILTDESSIQHVFQPLQITGGGVTFMIIQWTKQTASLRFGKTSVKLDNEALGQTIVVKTGDQAIQVWPIIGNVNTSNLESNDDRLFIETLKEIEQRMTTGGWYNLTKITGLLRLLYFDGVNSLAINVASKYGIVPLYTTIDFEKPFPISMNIRISTLDPSPFPGANTIEVTFQQLQKAPCLEQNGMTATVKNLIKATANLKGGVHLGQARGKDKEKEELVLEVDGKLQINGQESSLLAVEGITRIILKGLKPVVEKIIE